MSIAPYPSHYTAQPADLTLTALAELTTAPDTAPYFTGLDTAALMTVTPFIRTLLDDPDLAAAQATLGVTPGSMTFVGLSDTPDTYLGQAGKALLVNPAETGLEFGVVSGGDVSGRWKFHTDTDNSPASQYLQFDHANYTQATWVFISKSSADSIDMTALLQSFAWRDKIFLRSVAEPWKVLWFFLNNAGIDDGPSMGFEVVFAGSSGETFTVNDVLELGFVRGSTGMGDTLVAAQGGTPGFIPIWDSPYSVMLHSNLWFDTTTGDLYIDSLFLAGSLRVGNDPAMTANGTIRYTGTDVEARKGGAWVSMTQAAEVSRFFLIGV